NGRRRRRHRPSSADSADPSPDSRRSSSPLLLPLVHEPPFFDEVLGQLQPHHQLADLGASQRELALVGITPGLEPARPLLEEDALPTLELMGRHLALSRYRVEPFPPQES